MKNSAIILPAILCISANLATADLMHRYSFDDGTVNDSVNSANGSLLSGATVSGGQLNLGGNGAYASLPGGAISVNTYSALTFEMWLTSSSLNTSYTMAAVFGRSFTGSDDPLSVSNGGPFNDGDTWRGVQYIMIQPTRAGGPTASRVAITALSFEAERGVNGPSQINDNEEHHVALTIGATAIAYYIDGAFIGSTPLSGVSLADVSTEIAYLGRSNYPDPFFIGSINEFRIWGNVLSDDEIARSYALGPSVIPEPGVAAITLAGLAGLLLRRRTGCA